MINNININNNNNNEDSSSRLEKNRRLEYGEYYDTFFKPCDNCFSIFNTRYLFYINSNETVKVCQKCLDIINYEQRTRELRRKYEGGNL